jgi:hypothetical protein
MIHQFSYPNGETKEENKLELDRRFQVFETLPMPFWMYNADHKYFRESGYNLIVDRTSEKLSIHTADLVGCHKDNGGWEIILETSGRCTTYWSRNDGFASPFMETTLNTETPEEIKPLRHAIIKGIFSGKDRFKVRPKQ